MEDGGFTLVSFPLKRNRKRHVFRSSISKKHNNVDIKDAKPDFLSNYKTIEKNLDWLRKKFPEEYITKTLDSLKRLLKGRSINKIRIIGIGSFENSVASALQLILVKAIAHHFDVKNVFSEEPISSLSEKEYFQRHNVNVIECDELSKAIDNNGVTLLYMIHCEHYMYEAILKANWSVDLLRNLLFIGNDFQSYRSDVWLKTSFKQALKFSFLNAFASVCCSENLNILLEPYVFSNTCINYFTNDYLPKI